MTIAQSALKYAVPNDCIIKVPILSEQHRQIQYGKRTYLTFPCITVNYKDARKLRSGFSICDHNNRILQYNCVLTYMVYHNEISNHEKVILSYGVRNDFRS